MNSGKYIGVILFFSFLMTGFASTAIIFIPTLRYSVGNFLVSYRDQPIHRESLTADVGAVLNNVTPFMATSAPSTPSTMSSTTDFSAVDTFGDTVLPKTYEYKLLRSVDVCQLNTLGALGFQAIQFGGTMDASSGRDADCKNYRTVNVLDWVLFVRDK